jgi:CheY-like chemotaxis protein
MTVQYAATALVTPSPLLVMVVEDDALLRMLACDILSDGGYDTVEAGSAAEALALLGARSDVAVLFTDVDMPGRIDGLELARLAAARSPDLAIVVTTGSAKVGRGDLPPGARFLAKPYHPATLWATVEQLCVLA